MSIWGVSYELSYGEVSLAEVIHGNDLTMKKKMVHGFSIPLTHAASVPLAEVIHGKDLT